MADDVDISASRRGTAKLLIGAGLALVAVAAVWFFAGNPTARERRTSETTCRVMHGRDADCGAPIHVVGPAAVGAVGAVAAVVGGGMFAGARSPGGVRQRRDFDTTGPAFRIRLDDDTSRPPDQP